MLKITKEDAGAVFVVGQRHGKWLSDDSRRRLREDWWVSMANAGIDPAPKLLILPPEVDLPARDAPRCWVVSGVLDVPGEPRRRFEVLVTCRGDSDVAIDLLRARYKLDHRWKFKVAEQTEEAVVDLHPRLLPGEEPFPVDLSLADDVARRFLL